METAVSVRAVAKEDLDTVVQIGREVQQLHFDARPDLFSTPDTSTIREYISAKLDEGFDVLVAYTDERTVGYLIAEHISRPANPFRPAFEMFYIHQLGVVHDAKRLGIGRRLLDGAEALAKSRGVSTLRLDSWAFNTDAHRFFDSAGFAPLNHVFEKKLG